MLVGGTSTIWMWQNSTQIHSLDPDNYPVPPCWQNPADFPIKVVFSMGAVLGKKGAVFDSKKLQLLEKPKF